MVVAEGRTQNNVITFTEHDDDEGVNGNITYNLLDANKYPNFALNLSTGDLSVINPLDYESKPSYDLTIQAVDGGTPSLSAVVNVHVIVQDLNDNAPAFVPSVNECNITQTEPPVKIF